ncbi:MAG: hypothetical protein ACD_47C00713G0001 [uncultured bacterium]|nr:MAG: hypothetical protein ACD_47C00713G0001 [uncultured bacterium]
MSNFMCEKASMTQYLSSESSVSSASCIYSTASSLSSFARTLTVQYFTSEFALVEKAFFKGAIAAPPFFSSISAAWALTSHDSSPRQDTTSSIIPSPSFSPSAVSA